MAFFSHWFSNLQARLGNLGLAFHFFWKASPGTARWILVLIVIEGLAPILLVQGTRFVFNEYARLNDFNAWITGPALIYVAIIVAKECIGLTSRYLQALHEGRMSDHLSAVIQDRTGEMDMIHFESEAFHDQLYRAGFESEEHVIDIVQQAAQLIAGGITLIGLFALLALHAWWLPLLFLGAALPVFATLLIQAHGRYQWSKQITHDQRKSRYYNWLLVGQEAAGELRIFGLKTYFAKKFRALREHILQSRLRLDRSQALKVTTANLISLSLLALGMYFVLDQFQAGLVDAGSTALVGHSILLCRQSTQLLVRESANLYRSSLFLQDLRSLVDLESEITAPEHPVEPAALPNQTIEFKDVSFTYPLADNPAIDQLHLTIPHQKITVIFGENGSGKSTLAKLICRFFDPESGSIKLGGTDIRQLDPQALRQQIGVLFQHPVRYYFTAKENVTLGDLQAADAQERFEDAIRTAKAKEVIQSLPHSDDTSLGRWFQQGIEMSSGQWQRLALARVHYSDRPIWLLDEPTSAMDPWTEKEWLEQIAQVARQRTVIIITHRVSTASIADHVIVMSQGKAVEAGSPEALLHQKGHFAAIHSGSPSSGIPG